MTPTDELDHKLSQQLARANAAKLALETELAKEREEKLSLRKEIEMQRRAFTAEMFQLLATKELAEARFHASESQFLAEIERQHRLNSTLQHELGKNSASSAAAGSRHLFESLRLQGQPGVPRKQN
ncbi:MAG: hypothetical protein V4488_09585 [Pseudomonadota bacterium]